MLTYIALAGVLFEGQIILATFLHRTLLYSVSGPTFFLVAGIVFLTIWLALYKNWKSPYSVPGSGIRDVFASLAVIAVLAAAYPIVSSNGYVGEEFVMHGFYNGDVVTFAALVQKSFNTSFLVQENPFSGNGYLEYPTLLHGSVANFFSQLDTGKDWLHFLPIMTYAQILLTIPLFFLLWDVVYPQPKHDAEKWFGLVSRSKVYGLQLILVLIAIGLSFDSFVYPQSHFFLMGMFLACIALFAKAALQGGKDQHLALITAFIFALLLMASNSVTGTAAIALAGTLCYIRIFDKKRSIPERAIFLGLGILLLGVMKFASVGRTSLSNPHFSVSAASEMIRASLPAIVVFAASLYSLSRKQYLAIATGFASLIGFLVFFLSDRNIVTENASRFLYHGVLIGFVLVLPQLVQVLYWVRRELLLTSRLMSERIAGWILVTCFAFVIIIPIGASAGSAYLNLLRNDEHRITRNTALALSYIDEQSTADAVIIANPNDPMAIPLFTGRSVLRVNEYWLSEQDEVASTLDRAFTGDKDAQRKILQSGSHLFLTKDDAAVWDTTALVQVENTGDATIYAIK